MKQKQFAALSLVAWLAVVGWVGSMILAKPQAFSAGFAEADGALAAQIQLEIQQADALAVALGAIQTSPRRADEPSIIALPPTPEEAGLVTGTGSTAGTAADETATRVVSLIISGAGMVSRAMIDGVLVETGARLGDGAVVRRIEPRTVLIRDTEGVTHTLALRTPGEPGPERMP